MGGGGVVSTIFAWQPQTEKYVTRGDQVFLPGFLSQLNFGLIEKIFTS